MQRNERKIERFRSRENPPTTASSKFTSCKNSPHANMERRKEKPRPRGDGGLQANRNDAWRAKMVVWAIMRNGCCFGGPFLQGFAMCFFFLFFMFAPSFLKAKLLFLSSSKKKVTPFCFSMCLGLFGCKSGSQ